MLLCSTARLNEERVGLRRVVERLVDPSRKEAFETAKGLAVSQPVLLAAAHVGFGRFVGSALSERRAMEDCVEFAVTEATEAVSRFAGRGRLDRGSAGVGGEMGLGAEGALTDKADDLAGRKRAQAVDGDEVRVVRLCQHLDLACEGGEVLADGGEQAGEALDGLQVGDLDPGGSERLVGEEGGEAIFGVEVRKQTLVVGFEEREISVDAVDNACGIGEKLLTYGDEDGKAFLGAISWRTDKRQRGILTEGDASDRQGIVIVGLIAAPSGTAALCSPARVDLENGEPSGGETAGEASTVTAGTLDRHLDRLGKVGHRHARLGIAGRFGQGRRRHDH